MNAYAKGPVLGAGAFGEVFQATRKSDSRTVAIKQIKQNNDTQGTEFTALREIKTLYGKEQHPNIVELLDVVSNRGDLFLVYELMELGENTMWFLFDSHHLFPFPLYCIDLFEIISDKSVILTSANVRYYIHGILSGLHHLHTAGILHRDMKPNNVLVCRSRGNTSVKLGDFGMARSYIKRVLTPGVVTLYYRSPELLFGARRYTGAVDNWAAGVIFAEMMLRRILFEASSDIDMLSRIFHLLGTPTDRNWPQRKLLPAYLDFQPSAPQSLAALFTSATEQGVELLQSLLVLDPSQRLSAEQALEHAYFQEGEKTPLIVEDSSSPPSKKAKNAE